MPATGAAAPIRTDGPDHPSDAWCSKVALPRLVANEEELIMWSQTRGLWVQGLGAVALAAVATSAQADWTIKFDLIHIKGPMSL